MAQVTVKINGFAYTVGCEDGQEAHLQAMAEQVETRIGSIRALGNQSGEARLLVLAGLLMADELHDQALELERRRVAGPANGALDPAPPAGHQGPDPAVTERLRRLARRAEEIAGSLETP